MSDLKPKSVQTKCIGAVATSSDQHHCRHTATWLKNKLERPTLQLDQTYDAGPLPHLVHGNILMQT